MPKSEIAIGELKINPIDKNRLLVRSEWNESATILQEHEISILPHLMNFKPQFQHEETLASLIQSKNLPINAKNFIKKLHDCKLFIDSSSLIKYRNNAQKDQSVSIENIVLPTANNPRLCFETLKNNLPTLESPANLYIIDTSLDPKLCAQYKEQMGLLKPTKNAKFAYIGQKEIASVIHFLTGKGFDKITLDFALQPKAGVLNTGQGRNIGHLLNIGRHYLSTDDDVEWLFTESNPNAGLSFSTSLTSVEIKFLTHESYANQIKRAKPSDPRKIFKNFLSKSGDQLVNPSEKNLRFYPMKDRTLQSLFSRKARVKCVLPGLFGESGTSSSLGLFNLSPSGDHSLWETATNEKLKKRLLIRFSESNLIYDGDWFMAPCIALDGSHSFPPFPPEIRNQDGVWASILQKSTKQCPFAFLHRAIHHKPTRARIGIFEDLQRDVINVRFDQILLNYLHKLSNQQHEKMSWETIARIFLDISILNKKSFLEWIRDAEIEVLTQRKMHFHKLYARAKFPGKQVRLAQGIQNLEKSLLAYNPNNWSKKHKKDLNIQAYIKLR